MPATIQKGSTGSDVSYCQTLLNTHDYALNVDGVFGTGTEATVKAFQGDNGLQADGIVGANTWNALEASQTVAVTFADVAAHFPAMLPQKYVLHGAQCPSNPPGMTLKNIGSETTNCVQFTAWLLSATFPVTFTKAQWSLWMVSSADQGNVPIVPNWGPKVVIQWGGATTAPGDGPRLIQYFTETGGHSLLVMDYDADTDKILTLEANSAYGLNGAGWAQIGNLRDVLNPGPDWPKKVTQTWASRFGSKVAVHIARLNITGVQEWLERA